MGSFVNHLIFSKAWRYRLMRHGLFWLVYFAVFNIMDYLDNRFLAIKVALAYLPFNIVFVYVVLYQMVPRLLMRSAYLPFFLWYTGWAALWLTIEYFWGYLVVYRIWFVNNHVPSRNFRETMTYLSDPAYLTVANLMAGLGIGMLMYRYWRGEVWQKLQVKQEKTKTELELLKAQLHPHFLFNTLNNLHSLVIERSDKAPQMLMRLSAILSYVLYECRATEVPLEREIAICRDYIELERERFGDRLDVSLDFSGPIPGRMVPPMLFQPFIENAFRHGVSEQPGKVWMSIELSLRHTQLIFRVINSADFSVRIAGERDEGIGIRNIRRRLELLYPGRHQLSREKGDGVYIVALTIDLTPTAAANLAPADEKNEPQLYENAMFNY
jgi:hypothetical protein